MKNRSNPRTSAPRRPSNEHRPFTMPLEREALTKVVGGGSTAKEAYFVRCDRSTITS